VSARRPAWRTGGHIGPPLLYRLLLTDRRPPSPAPTVLPGTVAS